MTDGLDLGRGRFIPIAELKFQAEPSSGPGGQHANRSSTRVVVLFDIMDSSSLTASEKATLARKLASRLIGGRVLRVAIQSERSQLRNREAALARMEELLREALKPAVPRRPTRPTAGSKRRRISAKKRRGETKRQRRPPRADD
ncbi:MAG TPA: aminoacyl-tRNA hydrolase [Planctomycetes bacterium]|nr:aminoacyl-tRNA hydrolase [Planctomycetota bacterium]